VLAVIGRHLPTVLRTFMLTLAVVDDLLAIVIIAIFYTTDLSLLPLLCALVPLAAFAAAVQRRIRSWWLLLPLAVLTWALVHESGVHATVAAVLLAFTVPVLRSDQVGGPDAGPGLAEHLEHRFRPLSAGAAVPIFAFLSAGVTVGGLSGLASALTDRVALGIVAGLVIGKTIGITLATWLVARLTHAELDEGLTWADVVGLAMLGGVGFTVSLFIGELAFGLGSERFALSRSPFSPVPWPQPCSPRPCCGCGTAPTGASSPLLCVGRLPDGDRPARRDAPGGAHGTMWRLRRPGTGRPDTAGG
jgi:NhaA family Na+:H+ antiporter